MPAKLRPTKPRPTKTRPTKLRPTKPRPSPTEVCMRISRCELYYVMHQAMNIMQ
jgi:hypothetical protein